MDIVTPGIGIVFWSSLLFLIVLFILGKVAFKPIINGLKERESYIDEQLSAAEKAKEEMQNLTKENERLIQEGRQEKDRIITEAKAAANKIVSEAEDAAKVESGKIIAAAQDAIQSEKKAALGEIKDQVSTLSLKIAQRLLMKELEKDGAQAQLVDDLLQSLNKN